MCVEISTEHLGCQCKHYQNTSQCQIARRGEGPDGESHLLRHTKHLPARQPLLPDGFLGCRKLRATRPVQGLCGPCEREARRAERRRRAGEKMALGGKSGALAAGGWGAQDMSLTPPRSERGGSSSGSGAVFGTPDAEEEAEEVSSAVEKTRRSFIQIAEAHRATPVGVRAGGREEARAGAGADTGTEVAEEKKNGGGRGPPLPPGWPLRAG